MFLRLMHPAHTPKEKADFLKGEYGIGGRSHAVSGSDRSGESHDGKGIKLEKEGCPPVQLSWAQVAKRIDASIAHDRYMTPKELESIGALQEAEEVQTETNEPAPESDFSDGVEADEDMPDDDEPIDTEAVRERLADAGIVDGEVVDEEALRNSPFIQQVTELAGQVQVEQDSEESPVQNEGEVSPESSEQGQPYKVGDTVYLDDRPFVITQIGHFNVQLQDPSQAYPIFRSESIERFEQLLMLDERNTGLLSSDSVKEEHTFTTETEAVYPGEKNGLPYDVVIERLRMEEPAHHQPSQPAAENFRITDDHLGEGGAKAKYGNNLAAIRTLKQIEAEGRAATPQEQEVLSRYVGWGGLADAFDPDKPAWTDEYRQLAAILTPQEYEAARASTLNAHYTSPVVIRAMYDAVAQMGFTGGNILEPSMGVGNFFGMLPEGMQASRLYGVELDSITGRIAQQLYPKANITVAGFETTDRRDFFDLAIGNVPFGNYQVNDRAYNKLGFSIHNYFFAKAIDQVRPGGVIAFVTSRYTMDQQSPEVRRYIAQRAELLGAIRLPNNAFRANAGTEVVSDIIFLQKRDRAIEIEPDWVHVGEDADGLTMNSYFVQHPEMILGTLAKENTQYGRESFTVLPKEGVSLADQLHEAIGHIHGTYQEAALPDLGDNEAIDESIPADPDVRNPEPYGSYGNGSAMRVSSVGWLYDTLEETRRIARLTAEVTHNHPEGIKGAEATASAIFLARTGHGKGEIRDYIISEFDYDLSRPCDAIRPTFHHVESCQETVPEAITAFLEGNDFEDVIRTAVSLGGDCDTLTCIAGSIAEAYYVISCEMVTECRNRLPKDMQLVLDRFAEKKIPAEPEFHDPFLDGNELIEQAINAFHAEATKERLTSVLEAIRQRMHEDGHFLIPVIASEDGMEFTFRTVQTNDGKVWLVAFTSFAEFQKGQPSQIVSNFIDAMLKPNFQDQRKKTM